LGALPKIREENVSELQMVLLPKIREENVSELQMVFEFFRFM
jgi:hypothetical protein